MECIGMDWTYVVLAKLRSAAIYLIGSKMVKKQVNKSLKLAIQCLRHYRQEYFGWEAKMAAYGSPEGIKAQKKYAEYTAAITDLERLLYPPNQDKPL